MLGGKSIWLLRHAENSKDESTGFSLTDEGRKNTVDITLKIANLDVKAPVIILSSDVPRAHETGSIIARTFNGMAINALHLTSEFLRARDQEDAVNMFRTVHDLKEIAQEHGLDTPATLIIIGHKQNELLQLFSVMLDPEVFLEGKPVNEENRKSTQEIEELWSLSQEDLASHYSTVNEPVRVMGFLEAQHFRFTPESWSEFDLSCGRYIQTLDCV